MSVDDSPGDRAVEQAGEAIRTLVRELHCAIERKDVPALSDLVSADVFVFGASADSIAVGREQVVERAGSRFAGAQGVSVRVMAPQVQVGLCDSGRSAWFLDRFLLDVEHLGSPLHRIPVRLTGLAAFDDRWRVLAAYWSIPLRSNEHLHSLLRKGKIRPGTLLERGITPEAQPLAAAVARAVAKPDLLPGLLSSRADLFTIGSLAGDIFFGAEGRRWISEFARFPVDLRLRGGIRSALSPDGCTAWMGLHMDIDAGFTIPYRFLALWLCEDGEWKTVVLHDAVSVDPTNPGFDVL